MRIKMIATDLDRTLLKTDKTVSDHTARVFERCRDQGMKLMFATARPIRAVKALELGVCFDAGAYHNGAVLTIGGKIIQKRGIAAHTAVDLMLKAADTFKDLVISVEIDDILYANIDVEEEWQDGAVLTDFTDLPDMPFDKIVFWTAERSHIDGIMQLLPEDLHAAITEDILFLVMHEQARKRNAVEEAARRFGFTLSEVAAFGDDYSDMEMLRDCGEGIAVANAKDEVKAAADHICGSNDDDGPAKWIELNLL